MSKTLIWRDGEEIEVDTDSLDLPNAPGLVVVHDKLYKATIWRRCTDEEYDAIQAVISAAPRRLQAIFRDADYISRSDELYPVILAGAEQAVGAERAAELLKPEE